MSSDSIGQAAYLAYRTNITRMSIPEAVDRWQTKLNADDRAQWVKVYQAIVKHDAYVMTES